MAYAKAIEALADPTRRAVFERLRRGEQPVGRIAEGLAVTRPAVSQHLRVLEGAGLVSARRAGTRRIYRVEIRGLDELRNYLEGFWDDVLEAFRAEAERAAVPSSGRTPRATNPAAGRMRAPATTKRRPRHG
jgi:DNA-binding transcriptional ArsR family regulator